MSVIFIVLPLALIIVAAAVVAFIWAARSGQFDDLVSPGMRVLQEEGDEAPAPPATDASGDGGSGAAGEERPLQPPLEEDEQQQQRADRDAGPP
jgi:cbb3-type cytochrome oxidase maturation protein